MPQEGYDATFKPQMVLEALLDSTFQSNPLPMTITSIDEGRIIAVNECFLAVTGYTREEVIGRTMIEIGLWNDHDGRAARIAELRATAMTQHMELQHRTKQGDVRDLLISAELIDWHGKRCILAVSQDITERKRAEAAVRLRERAINAVSSGILITDPHQPDNPIIYCNNGFERMTGYRAAEVLGRNCRFLQGPDTDPAALALIREHLAREQELRITLLNYRRDGTPFWNDLIISPVHDGHGNLLQFVGTQTDVTARIRAESALQQAHAEATGLTEQVQRSRDILRILFDGLGDGLMLLDHTGVILAINQAMAALLGGSAQGLVGQRWQALSHNDRKSPLQSVNSTLHDGRVRRRRERYTRQGQQRVIDIQVLPLTSRRHHVDQIIVHVVDVTEQLQLETMAAQNEQFVATGRLAMTVAHELNTPLLSIQSCLYMADKADAAARKVYLDLAQEEIQRISTILEQLLDLHRSHSDTTTQVDVNALIERVILLMSGMLAKHQVVVERALAADLPLLRINAYHLRQVLLNLILNAIDAMPTGGSLRISTAVPADGTSLLLTVADTGTGIAPDTQASIFEPFFTTKSHGSGLGLAISQKLMAHYGGEISVQSAPGAGSTFTVRLPMWQS